MKVCKNCNTQNDDTQTFCGQCGQRLEENIQGSVETLNSTPTVQPVVNNVVPNQNNKSNMVLIISLIVSVVVIAILVGIFVIKPLFDNKSNNEPKTNNSSTINNSDAGSNKNTNTKKGTKTYKVGEKVTLLDDSSWHVISTDGDKVTLLLDKLVADNMGYGDGSDEFHQKYENSNVKKYVEETYLPELKSSLEKYKGDTTNLKARLITMNEFLKLVGQKMMSDGMYSNIDFDRTDEQSANEEWLKMTKTFWTMSNVKDYNPSYDRYGAYAVLVNEDSVTLWTDYSAKNNAEGYKGSFLGIRPVIETVTSNIK